MGRNVKTIEIPWWLQLSITQTVTFLPRLSFGTVRSEVRILSPRPLFQALTGSPCCPFPFDVLCRSSFEVAPPYRFPSPLPFVLVIASHGECHHLLRACSALPCECLTIP